MAELPQVQGHARGISPSASQPRGERRILAPMAPQVLDQWKQKMLQKLRAGENFRVEAVWRYNGNEDAEPNTFTWVGSPVIEAINVNRARKVYIRWEPEPDNVYPFPVANVTYLALKLLEAPPVMVGGVRYEEFQRRAGDMTHDSSSSEAEPDPPKYSVGDVRTWKTLLDEGRDIFAVTSQLRSDLRISHDPSDNVRMHLDTLVAWIKQSMTLTDWNDPLNVELGNGVLRTLRATIMAEQGGVISNLASALKVYDDPADVMGAAISKELARVKAERRTFAKKKCDTCGKLGHLASTCYVGKRQGTTANRQQALPRATAPPTQPQRGNIFPTGGQRS